MTIEVACKCGYLCVLQQQARMSWGDGCVASLLHFVGDFQRKVPIPLTDNFNLVVGETQVNEGHEQRGWMQRGENQCEWDLANCVPSWSHQRDDHLSH